MSEGPLAGLKVVDIGVGLAPSLATKLLADAGANVVRMEPPGGDPFYDHYPAYAFWQRNKTILRWSPDALAAELEHAELCVAGGEDHPGLAWSHAPAMPRGNRTTLLSFDAQPPAMRQTPAVDLLMQARSGLCHEHFTRRPLAYAFPAPSYGAALNGLAAALAAVYAQRSGQPGRHISASLLQGALFWGASLWLDVDGREPVGEAKTPMDPRQLIFRCKDGVFLQLTMGVPGTLYRLHRVLGIASDVSETDRSIPTGKGDPRNFFGDIDLLSPRFAERPASELLPALQAANVVAEKVADPGECWDDEQTKTNGVIAQAPDGTRGVGLPFHVRAHRPGLPSRCADRSVLPLAGVRVVDCGSFVAGPYASVLLSDLGADVIKLEPLGGDPMRAMLRQVAPASRGKRSIAIDGKTEQGRRLMEDVCVSADIVHHNFRPGVSARLGIDHASLSRRKPDIIVLESSAYGARGPKAGQPGFDMAFQAMSGLERSGGTPDEPLWYRFAAADYGTGLQGAIGMLVALVARAGGSGGAEVETSLLNGSLFLMSEVIRQRDGNLAGVNGPDAGLLGPHPAERLYECDDGWIAVAARDDAMASRMLACLGIADATARRDWSSAQADAVATALGKLTAVDALAILRDAEVWSEFCEPDGWAAAKREPILRQIGTVGEGDAVCVGTLTQIGQAFTIDGGKPMERERNGRLDAIGGSSLAILAELGIDHGNADRLVVEGHVRALVPLLPEAKDA